MNEQFKKFIQKPHHASRNTQYAIRVMIVDNSLFMRQLVTELCKTAPDICDIGTAKSGEEALSLLPQIKPDVITLDLEMPGMSGLATLKKIMATYPTPVVILSAYSREGADVTIECLEEGAVSFVLKPSGEMSLDIAKVKDKLLAEIRVAAQVRISSLVKREAPKTRKIKHEIRDTRYDSRIIVIGASTGGPQTLEMICAALPSDFPIPIVMVLHMPSQAFTQSFAARLNDQSPLEIKEAEQHESLMPGFIYIAPGGSHLSIEAKRQRSTETGRQVDENDSMPPWFVLSKDEKDIHSPSIDIAMTSAAKFYREKTLGVILTGMGQDGLEGMKQIKEAGGQTIVQDESSSLIFGMPKAVIDSGVADNVLSTTQISEALMELVARNAQGVRRDAQKEETNGSRL